MQQQWYICTCRYIHCHYIFYMYMLLMLWRCTSCRLNDDVRSTCEWFFKGNLLGTWKFWTRRPSAIPSRKICNLRCAQMCACKHRAVTEQEYQADLKVKKTYVNHDKTRLRRLKFWGLWLCAISGPWLTLELGFINGVEIWWPQPSRSTRPLRLLLSSSQTPKNPLGRLQGSAKRLHFSDNLCLPDHC